MTKILSYLVVILLIALIPDNTWSIFWSKWSTFFNHLKKGFKDSRFFYPLKLAEELQAFFPTLEARLALGIKSLDLNIPQYKFYTSLLFRLLEVHRQMGISLKQILPELRINLGRDIQFEKKNRRIISGSNLQFFMTTMTTWSFILISSQMAELPLSPMNLFIIGLLQLAGIIFFNAAVRFLRFKMFNKFSDFIESFYLLMSLSEVGLSIGQVLHESKILEKEALSDSLFRSIAERLTGLVKRWKDNGISPKAELSELISELWHLKEEQFERFLKYLEILKFSTLAIFYLPAYFLYLYSIFQFFMEQ